MLLGDSDEFDEGEKLVLWYSSSNNSFTCKTFSGDSTKGAQLKGVDFKFHQKLSQNWVTFETFYKLDELLPIEDVEEASNEDVLTLPLRCLSEILHKSKVFFNGAPRDATEEVEKLTTDSKSVQAQIFRTCVSIEKLLISPFFNSYTRLESGRGGQHRKIRGEGKSHHSSARISF